MGDVEAESIDLQRLGNGPHIEVCALESSMGHFPRLKWLIRPESVGSESSESPTHGIQQVGLRRVEATGDDPPPFPGNFFPLGSDVSIPTLLALGCQLASTSHGLRFVFAPFVALCVVIE